MRAGRDLAGLALVAAASAACPGQALAGDSATAAGRVGASVIEPLTLTAIEPLRFGVMAVSETESGAITVDPDTGSSIISGGLGSLCPSGASCFARPALFGVAGEAGRHYRIEAPASAIAQHEGGSAPALAVSAIRVSASGGSGGAVRRMLDDGGNDSFRLGGTLVIPAGSAPGMYRAELSVVVSYD
ncbi:MAG: DUF4402 domain-containing protein [Erythrobacter sp.]